MEVAGPIILAIAILTVFLSYITGLKYAISDTFARTRLIMTSFFLFIVATLTISFYPYALMSLPYVAPAFFLAFFLGILLGYLVGVREAEQRISMEGLNNYLKHFAHIHLADIASLKWWSLINFYTVMGALLMINLIGFSTVILKGNTSWIVATCAVGAFLSGTLVPYLLHLWNLKMRGRER
jgi:hypothetical protein